MNSHKNITESTNKMAKCECGGLMTIYYDGTLYYGACNHCNKKSKAYHSCIGLMNEQFTKFIQKSC